MFGLKKKKGPTQPFTHANDCKIMRPTPPSRSSGRRSRRGTGRRSARAGPNTSMTPSPRIRATGSTPTTRPPSATRPSASTAIRPIPFSSKPS
jgi:hypothetical protein